MYIAAISLIAPIGNLIIVPSFLKVPSQVNLIVVGRKLWARDWRVLGLVPVNPSSLMLQFWFRKRCNGNHCSPLSKVYCQLHPVAQPTIKLFMLKSLKNHTFCSYEKFIKTDKSSWWNKAKVVVFPSYWKFIEIETTNKDVLPWMADERFKSKALSETLASTEYVINLSTSIIKIVRFRFNQWLPEYKH